MIKDSHKVFLAEVHQNKKFKAWLKEVEDERPLIPSFNPMDTAHKGNVWEYYSGRKEGYELALLHLGIKLND